MRRGLSSLMLLGVIAWVPVLAKAQSASDRVQVVAASGGGQPIVAKTDAEGTIHVVSESPSGPVYSKSTDNGATFSPPMPVLDSRMSRPAGLVVNVWDMVVGKGGRVHVAMGTNAWKLKLPQNEWGFYYANLDPGAKAFSPVRNINQTPSEGFSLAADEKGMVTACFLKDKLYACVSRDNGKTFGPPVEINPTFNPCNCCTTSATYAADGKLAVIYREETNNDRDMYFVLWDQQKRQSAKKKISTTLWNIDACPMTYYTIERAGDGFTAVWPTRGSVYFAKLDGQGNVQSPGEIKTPGTAGMRTGTIALPASDGATLVAWKKDNQLGWQLYDGAGQPVGQPGSTNSAGSGVAGVATANGRFILFR